MLANVLYTVPGKPLLSQIKYIEKLFLLISVDEFLENFGYLLKRTHQYCSDIKPEYLSVQRKKKQNAQISKITTTRHIMDVHLSQKETVQCVHSVMSKQNGHQNT